MMSVAMRIEPKQMEAWVEKLQFNMQKFLLDSERTTEEKLKFMQHQHSLLNVIIKVLNGDAYFVGCSPSVKK